MPRFLDPATNAIIVPMGANVVTIASGVDVTFAPGTYTHAAFDSLMATIASFGYNSVRLWYWPTNAGNQAGDAGLDAAMLANVADGIITANVRGLRVILQMGGIPNTGNYLPPTTEASVQAYGGYTIPNWLQFTPLGLSSAQAFLHDQLAGLVSNGVTAAMILAICLTGEFSMSLTQYPMNQTGGTAQYTKAGPYSLGTSASRNAMADAESVLYVNGLVNTVLSNTTFAHTYTMMQLTSSAYPGVTSQLYLPNAALLTNANVTSVGLSLYATYDLPLYDFIQSYGVTFPLPTQPVMALETGWLTSYLPNHAGQTYNGLVEIQTNWQKEMCGYGIYGFSWYTWSGVGVAYEPMTASSNVFATNLSPNVIGDGCPQLKSINTLFLNRGGQDYETVILDAQGNVPGYVYSSVGGVANYYEVPGAAIAVENVTFHPEGSILDQIGASSFDVPLSTARNNALTRGARYLIREKGSNIVMARGIVVKRDITGGIAGDKAHITGVDWADELRRMTVTTGFSTPAVVGEPFVITGARLCNLLAPTWTWAFVTDVGSAYDGVPFATTGSIGQGVANFASSRHLHFKRSPSALGSTTRVLNMGVFGQDSGLILIAGLANPTIAAVNTTYLRIIEDGSPQIQQDFNIINLLVPYGTGSGLAQVSLRPLYDPNYETILPNGWRVCNNTNFPGFQLGYPIYRRPRQDQGGDLFEYFIYEPNSYTSDGPWETQWTQSQIGVGGTGSPADFVAAASYLYTASVSHLKWNNVPNETYTVTTSGNGDLRDLGGKQVRLIYRGIALERIGLGQQNRSVSIDLNKMLTVMSVEVQQDQNGIPHATWKLSTNSQYEITDTSVMIGALEQIQYGNFTAAAYPNDREFPIDEFLDSNHPISFPVPGNAGTAQIIEAKLSLYVRAAQLPVMPNPHAHAAPIPAIPHDVAALPHDVNAVAHNTNFANAANYTFRVGGVAVPGAGVNYNPKSELTIAGHPPSNVKTVVTDGQYLYTVDGSFDGKQIDVTSQLLTITPAVATGDGSSGNLVATTGASTGSGPTGGTVPKTSGGKGGAITSSDPLARNFATTTKSGADPALDALGMTWGMYLNPASLPTVTATIGSVIVGSVTTAGKLDATAAVNANGAGTQDFAIQIAVASATGDNASGLCRVYGALQMRVVMGSISKIGVSI